MEGSHGPRGALIAGREIPGESQGGRIKRERNVSSVLAAHLVISVASVNVGRFSNVSEDKVRGGWSY